MLNDLLKNVLIISVSGSLIALFLLVLRQFIQNKFSEKWYYYVWLIVIARLIVPFGLPINIGGYTLSSITDNVPIIIGVPDAEPLESTGAMVTDIAFPLNMKPQLNIETPLPPDISGIVINTPEPSTVIAVPKTNIDYTVLLPFIGLIWLITAMTLFINKMISYYRFTHFIRAGLKPITDDTILDICYDVCQLLGLKREVPVFSGKAVGSPMLIGLLKPMIVLPDAQAENTMHLKYVFMHELTHYKRFDVCYKWLMQIILCVHWFNPIVYLVGREVNKSCELSCDEAVIKRLTSKEQRAYGDTLLRSFEMTSGYNNPIVSLTLTENTKFMKKRLGAIMRFHKKSKIAPSISVLLTFVLCTGAMFTGVYAEVPVKNTEMNTIKTETEKPLAVSANDLQDIQAIPYTSIGARAYSSKWASATGIEADTYKKQLDEKMKWMEALYNEKKERFMLNETISEKEATNTLGMQYMYEESSVYRDMANVGNTFQLLPYDSSFSRSGSKKYYERSVFYVHGPSTLVLNAFYELNEGKLAFFIVSPEGKTVFINTATNKYNNNSITVPLSAGLWSIVTINESETGVIKGVQKIEGKIVSSEEVTVSINIPELEADETITYGPYYLNKKDAWSADIESFEGNGSIFVADMKEDEAFNHCVVIEKAPDGFAFLADEAKYYYVTIGNNGDTPLTNIKGKLTISLKGVYQSTKESELKIDIPAINAGDYKEYGLYDLKKGDVISANLTWSNVEGGVFFAVGKEYGDFKGYYSNYGKRGKYLAENISIREDGLYYIFIGNPSTVKPEVKGVSGSIAIGRKSDNNSRIIIDIPTVSGETFVKNYGQFNLAKNEQILADINWNGEGAVMFLYTQEEFSITDITRLVDKGILPLDSDNKIFNGSDNVPVLSSNFTYVQNYKELKLNFTTTPNKPIRWANQIPETGEYYIYIIATGDTGITNIKGEITFGAQANKDSDNVSANEIPSVWMPGRLTKEQLPNDLKSWIKECDKKKDLYITSKNDMWYVYCNLISGAYALDMDNVSVPGVKITLSDASGKGDGYALLSVPRHYGNIQVFYNNKKVQFTEDGSDTVDFDKDSTVLAYYNKNSAKADNYSQDINGYEASLKFMNFSGSKVIYELDYQQAVKVGFSISGDVTGDYKIAFITENNDILLKASSYSGNSASKPIEIPKGKTKVVLVGEQATGNCKIGITAKNESVVISLKSKNTYNISESGSFNAEDGQRLTLNIVSSIKGGTVDLFLFDPNGKEQRITIGSSGFSKEIKLSKGLWQYNCSGIFKDGGSLQITGIASK